VCLRCVEPRGALRHAGDRAERGQRARGARGREGRGCEAARVGSGTRSGHVVRGCGQDGRHIGREEGDMWRRAAGGASLGGVYGTEGPRLAVGVDMVVIVVVVVVVAVGAAWRAAGGVHTMSRHALMEVKGAGGGVSGKKRRGGGRRGDGEKNRQAQHDERRRNEQRETRRRSRWSVQ
jgi:hypothetical protein